MHSVFVLTCLALVMPFASVWALAPIPSQEAKPLPVPAAVLLSIPPGPQRFSFQFDVWTEDKQCHSTGRINIEAQNSNEARDVVFAIGALTAGEFVRERCGIGSVVLKGFQPEKGQYSRVKSARLKLVDVKSGGITLTPLGGAKIETE